MKFMASKNLGSLSFIYILLIIQRIYFFCTYVQSRGRAIKILISRRFEKKGLIRNFEKINYGGIKNEKV